MTSPLSAGDLRAARERLGFAGEAPERGSGPPRGPKGSNTISASKISRWEDCQLQFKFKHLDREPDYPTAAMRRGRAVHATLETVGRAAVTRGGPVAPEREALAAEFRERAASNKLTSAEARGAATVLEEVRASLDFANTISVEEPFQLEIADDTYVVGIFDRIDYHPCASGGPGVYEIVDYKSGEYVPTVAEAMADVQVGLYLVAVRVALDATRGSSPCPSIKASFWYLPRNEKVEVWWTEELHESTIARLRIAAAEIASAEADPSSCVASPGANCLQCAFRDRCPAYARIIQTKSSPLAAAYEGDETLLLERKRLSDLAKIFDEQRKECDEVIKARLADRPNLLAGGLRARVVVKPRYEDGSLDDVAAALAEALPPDVNGDDVRAEIAGLDKRRLNAYLARFDTATKKRLEEVVASLKTMHDGYSYVMVTELPKVKLGGAK